MKLNYKKYGDAGDAVIILHGIFGMLDNWHSFASQLSKDCDTLIDQLKTVGALNQSDVQIFQKWFHISGYLSFIKSEGRCQMQLLKEMTGLR